MMETLATKLRKARMMVARLPAREQAPWARRLVKVASHMRQLRVSGDEVYDRDTGTWREDDWGLPGAPTDLDIANWLDRVYNTVSERVEVVAKKGGEVLKEGGAVVASAAFPPALVVVGVLVALYLSRKH